MKRPDIDIDWADLELFLAIDRAGSLSGAGRALGVKQSTVSRRLTALEERLGQALFLRSHEGVVPTALGDSWRGPSERAEQAVLEARRATVERVDGIQGRVRVATLLTLADLFLAPALPELLERHPGLSIDLLASSEIADLERLEADIALRLFRPRTGDFITRSLGSFHLGAFATRQVAMRTFGQPVADWPWLGWSSPRLTPPAQVVWEREEGVVPQVRFSSPTTMLAAARVGVGVTLLSEEMGRGEVNMVELEVPSLPRIQLTFWLVVHRELRGAPHIDAVWRWLVELFERQSATGGG